MKSLGINATVTRLKICKILNPRYPSYLPYAVEGEDEEVDSSQFADLTDPAILRVQMKGIQHDGYYPGSNATAKM